MLRDFGVNLLVEFDLLVCSAHSQAIRPQPGGPVGEPHWSTEVWSYCCVRLLHHWDSRDNQS